MTRSRFPWRGLLLGLALELPTVFWVVSSEVTAKVFISSWSLTMTAVVMLLGLLTLNALLARWRPSWVLTRVELLVVYVMIASTSVIYGYQAIQVLLPSLGGAHQFATAENQYENVLWPLLKHWAIIDDPTALRGLFSGYATPPWGLLLPRLLTYGSFMLAVYATTLGIVLLLSRQWIEDERLTFPIAALPLEMTTDRWPVFRSRLMWLGFAIPLVLETLLALKFYFPVVPALEMKHTPHPEWFPNRPWTVFRHIWWGWTPFIVGLAYLAPTEIQFSCWFFVLFNLMLRVIGVTLGWTDPQGARNATDFPWLVELTSGGFLAFALCSLWSARRNLANLLRSAVGEEGQDRQTARTGLGLILLGAAGVAVFCSQLGIRLPIVAGVFVLYFLVAITLSRMRAEGGMAWAFGPDRAPHNLLVWLCGSTAFDRQSLVSLGQLHWFFADMRFAVLPSQMESAKTAHEAGLKPTHLAAVILTATVTAIAAGMIAASQQWFSLGASTANVYGAAQWAARSSCNLPMTWLRLPTNPDWFRVGMMGVGAVLVTVMHIARQRVLWWPLHPVGFVMANTGAGYSFLEHYFLAWLLKTAVLKWGGNKLYRQSLPFVVGVILGDIVTQTLWSLVATLLGWPVYQFIS